MTIPSYGVLDLRNTEYAQIPLGQIGEDRLFEALAYQLQMYNGIASELVGSLTFPTAQHMTRFGAQGSGVMLPADDYSRVDVQQIGGGETLGFPIRKYQYAIGWNREYLRRHTVGEFQAVLDEAQRADLRMMIASIKTALFNKTNTTFEDRRFGTLTIKRLVNADSSFIPDYDGVSFDSSTHTHYLATNNASLTAASLDAMENHLAEHGYIDNLVLYIHPDQESAIRAFTPDFVPAINPLILNPLGVYSHVSDVNDWVHIIGRYKRFEVRKRTWVPSGYLFAYSEQGQDSARNPLARRLSDITEDNGLHVAGDDDRFPLRAQWMEHWFGVAGYNRLNGVCLQVVNTTTYTSPTFTF